MKVPFKTAREQHHYEFCRRCGKDPTSAFYVNGKPRIDHDLTRQMYWRGRQGRKLTHHQDGMAWAAWAAGRDDYRSIGPWL